MRSSSAITLLLLLCVVNINAEQLMWLKDVISSKGWDLGYGVVMKLIEANDKEKNVPIMERLSLDVNLGDLLGASVTKAKSDGLELDLYVKKTAEVEEGREKKEGGKHMMMQMIIGYKAAIVVTAMFALMKALTLKALFLAKAALIMSFFALLTKLKGHQGTPEIVEVEQHGYPSHFITKDMVYQGYGGGYGKEAQSTNIYQDVVYAPSGGAAQTGADSNSAYSHHVASVHDPNIQGRSSRKDEIIIDDVDRKNKESDFIKTLHSDNMLIVKKYSSPVGT